MTEIARIKIEYRPLGSLKLNPRNARLHSDNQVVEIARSISRFGFLNPLLVDSDGTIIAGEGRYLAARKLGLLEAPVIELTGLSEAQCRALALADNRIPLPVVRRLVGYGRFDGVETARVMARVYAAARLLVDFFQPSFKFKEKRREGPPTATSTPESGLQCLPIGNDVAEVQQVWLPSLRQLPNQLPRAVHDKDAAIISVLLLGHAGWLQGEVQPFCELSCMRLVVSPIGIVVIGDSRCRLLRSTNSSDQCLPRSVALASFTGGNRKSAVSLSRRSWTMRWNTRSTSLSAPRRSRCASRGSTNRVRALRSESLHGGGKPGAGALSIVTQLK
ncbi:hypothetical protein ACVMHR_010321 [Bradyrhizobium diazoefficiens]|uniref:Bll1694 protein n=3 Tax=Nitrobacteraceae TaxID=41294 RepID=A0A0E3VY17_9BRAD|nr:Bll1694 protein [Bradyrhizobium diazoefficiens]